jgi:long-subunit acyl-CoA synthetase (AMP-forming)
MESMALAVSMSVCVTLLGSATKDMVADKTTICTGINYRLKADDIAYIFNHADVEAIIVDKEFEDLLDEYRQDHPAIPIIVDHDDETETQCPFTQAIRQGIAINKESGDLG